MMVPGILLRRHHAWFGWLDLPRGSELSLPIGSSRPGSQSVPSDGEQK